MNDVMYQDIDQAIVSAYKHAKKDNVRLSDEARMVVGAEVLYQKLFGRNLNKSMYFDDEDQKKVQCCICVNNDTFVGVGNSKHKSKYNACKKFYNRYIKYTK